MSAATLISEAKRSLDVGSLEQASAAAFGSLQAMSESGASDLLAEAVRLLAASQTPPDELQVASASLDEMLERFRTEGNITGEVRALLALSELRCARLQADEALQAVEELLSLGDLGSEGRSLRAQVLNVQVNAHLIREAPREAMDAARELLELAQKSAEVESEAKAWQAMAGAHILDVGRSSASTDALQAAQRAAELYMSLGQKRGEATALVAVARAWLSKRDASEGLKAAERALDCWREVGQTRGAVSALEVMVQAYAMQNNPMAGIRAANQELATVQRSGNKRGQLDFLEMIAHTHAVLREPISAIHYARQALELYWVLDDRSGQGWTLNTIAQMQRMQGKMEEATETAKQALDTFRQTGNIGGEEQAAGTLSTILADRGMPERAPTRKKALQALQSLVGAIRSRNAAGVKKAEASLDQFRVSVADQEVVSALQPILQQDEGAVAFLEEQGWDLGRKNEGEGQLGGTHIKVYDHKVFYLQTIINGMNFGPQFRVVHPYRKDPNDPALKGVYEAQVHMSVSHLTETEAWQMEQAYRPGILDSGLQAGTSGAFP